MVDQVDPANMTEAQLDDLFYNQVCPHHLIYCLPLDKSKIDWEIGTEIIVSSLLVLLGIVGQ